MNDAQEHRHDPKPILSQPEVAARLRTARKHSGLSQHQVATMLTLSRPAISEIEAGRRKISVQEAARFAQIYDVSVEWLILPDENHVDPAVELAARQLRHLESADLDKLLQLIRSLKDVSE